MIMVEVPKNVSGQSYVFLTKDMSGSVTDDTVLRGTCVVPVGTLSHDGTNVVAQLIDPLSAVSQLRLETR